MTRSFVPTARSVAAEVLTRVIADGAFAAAALDAELDRSVQLDGRDRGLATELVYGTLRLLGWVEARLDRHAKHGVASLEPRVRSHLAIAAYQILVLTRIPPFAAVNEAVTAVRVARGEKVAGFANAILRKIAREPKPEASEVERAALASIDPMLRDAIVRAIGEEGAIRLVSGHGGPPPLGIRVEAESARQSWIEELRAAKPSASFEAGALCPRAILARGAGRVVDLPGYAAGSWTPQEEGSQFVALALGARPGDVVLDACSGRGNKTGMLVGAVGPSGAVDAADIHPKKLERLGSELARIRCAVRHTYAVDWSVGTASVRGPYDRALIDAPCSGTGTIRRRPELSLRRGEGDARVLATLQRAILERVAGLVRPGGRLVYAVCSVLREEAEDVVAGVEALGLRPAPFDDPNVVKVFADATSFRVLPHEHGTDGYYAASFVKVA